MTMRGQGRGVRRPWAGMLIVAALVVAAPAAGQDAEGVSFIGGMGYEHGGPGPDLVSALDRGGLGDVQPGTCAGAICQDSTYYPQHFSEGIGLVVTLGFRYRFPGPYSLDALLSNGQRGHAEGYTEQPLQNQLTVTYNSYVLKSTIGVHLGPIRLGVGPALLFTEWNAVANSAVEEHSSSRTVGTVASISYSVSLPSTVLGFQAGVQQFGSVDVPNSMKIPIDAAYRTWNVGVTVNPRGR